MASVVRLGGTAKARVYAVDFTRPDGERRRWTLGSVGRSSAVEAKCRIESIVSRVSLNLPLHPQDQAWLRGLAPVLISRLGRTGLVSPEVLEAGVITLGQWVERYLAEGRTRWSPRTCELYSQTTTLLVDEVGADRTLAAVDRNTCAAWVGSLRETGLSEATVRLHVRQGKACFGAAVKRGLLSVNPLDGERSRSVAAQRDRFVTAGEARKVMSAVASPEARTIVAFARFAGLRVPSESHAVLWEDVELERGRFRVWSQKTKAERVVPILPALRECLCELIEVGRRRKGRVVLGSSNNLNRMLRRAVKKAGVKPWDRPWQTLRQGFVTDLRERFPEQVVAAWAGHSVAVATNHYAQVLDAHFERAAGGDCSGILSGMAANGAGIRGKIGFRSETPNCRKPASDGNLRNGPARIRTGDRAIMSMTSSAG